MKKPLVIGFYLIFLMLLISGLMYAVPTYADRFFDEDWSTFPSKSLLMKIHGAASMGILLIVGGILQVHSLGRIGRRKNRVSGIALITLLTTVVVTSYILYYSGSESLREICSDMHTISGLITAIFIAWHAGLIRSRSNRYDEGQSVANLMQQNLTSRL